MSTTTAPQQPPTAPPQQPPTAPPPAERPGDDGPAPRTSSRVIAILVIVLGALIAVGTVASAAWGTVAAGVVHTSSRTVAVAGVDELKVDLAAGALHVRYGDVSDATLEVTGARSADSWTFERRDGDLVLASPDSPFWGSWFGGNGRAVLTLPAQLESRGIDADFQLAAGSLKVEGRYDDLGIEMGAGAAQVTANARSFELDLSAGSADLDLAGVTEAEFAVSAGAVDATMTGPVPTRVAIDVTAGSLDLRLPDGTYDVRGDSDSAAGKLHNGLTASSTSSNVVDVKVSAGEVTLRQAR